MPDTVARMLREQARRRGDHPLLICDADRIGYAEAERRSAVLAASLIDLGAGKGTHVGLLYPNGTQFVVAMLAAARIGAVVVPFTTFGIARDIHDQLVHADVEIMLATASFRGRDFAAALRDLDDVAVPTLRRVLIDAQPADAGDPALLRAMEDDVDGSDVLTIVYTSGTASAPKGVVHTHAALIGHQRNLNTIRALTEDDRLFCNSPFFWIGGLAFGLLATLVAGSTLVCSTATDPDETLDLLEAVRPTLTNGYVAGIAHLARHPGIGGRDLSSMRRGNLYPIMAPQARPADPELRHNMLGMTEAGGVVLLSGDETDQPEHRRGSFGRAAPGFETKVVDEQGRPATGAGELCIRGPYVMQRYYKRSREECFDANGWLHTGDLVRTDTDGFFYFIGRIGAMIKTAGADVSPAEVEKAIARVSGGSTAYVFGVPDQDRGQTVVAVVAADPETFDEPALRDALKRELAAYKIPTRIVVLPQTQIPLLASGKVDMNRLAAVARV